MPRSTGAALQVRYYFVFPEGSGSTKDIKDASAACVAVVVASVSVTRVLLIPLVIATQKALTKSLRRGVLVVVRPLRVEALPTLSITGAGTQAGLVPLIYRNLGTVVVAAIATIITVAAVVTVLAVTVLAVVTVDSVAAIAAVIAIIAVIIADSALLRLTSQNAVSSLVIDAVAITTLALRISLITISSILGLRCRAGHGENT
jgi:hypothetical protein